MDKKNPSGATYSSTLDYLSRGLGYWLVSLLALLAGEAYRSQAIIGIDMLKLVPFSVLTFPFFVVYSLVYDSPELGEKRTLKVSGSHRILIRKNRQNALISASGVCVMSAAIALFVLLQVEGISLNISLIKTCLANEWDRLIYLVILTFLYWQYTSWLFKHKRQVLVFCVRFEVFLPVLICVCLNYYTGVHLLKDGFVWTECILPISLYVWYMIIHLIHQQTQAISARKFASITAISFLAIFITYLIFSLSSRHDGVAMVIGDLLLSGLLALYLSTLELWRTTSMISHLSERYELMELDPPTAPDIAEKRSRFFRATLSAQAAAFVGSSLIFLIGDKFGTVFLIGTVLHSLLGFTVWYRYGNDDAMKTETWRHYKVVFGFAYFVILLLDVVWNVPFQTNAIPDLSSLASAIVIGAFIIMTTIPISQFLKRLGATGSPSQFFYALNDKRDVFEFATLLSVSVFGAAVIIHNVTSPESTSLSNKISAVCIVSFLQAVVFSIIVNYRKLFPERDSGERNDVAKSGQS